MAHEPDQSKSCRRTVAQWCGIAVTGALLLAVPLLALPGRALADATAADQHRHLSSDRRKSVIIYRGLSDRQVVVVPRHAPEGNIVLVYPDRPRAHRLHRKGGSGAAIVPPSQGVIIPPLGDATAPALTGTPFPRERHFYDHDFHDHRRHNHRRWRHGHDGHDGVPSWTRKRDFDEGFRGRAHRPKAHWDGRAGGRFMGGHGRGSGHHSGFGSHGWSRGSHFGGYGWR